MSSSFLPVPDLSGHMNSLSCFSFSLVLSCHYASCKISQPQPRSAYVASTWPSECECFHLYERGQSSHDTDLWWRENRRACRNITDYDQRKHTPQHLAKALRQNSHISMCHMQMRSTLRQNNICCLVADAVFSISCQPIYYNSHKIRKIIYLVLEEFRLYKRQENLWTAR